MHSVVIHHHLYQPPREDPWLEVVPTEPSAAPDHDWNARINRECYARHAGRGDALPMRQAATGVPPHVIPTRVPALHAW